MKELLRVILPKYIKPEVLLGADIVKLNHADPKLQKEDGDLSIGVEALDFFIAQCESNFLKPEKVALFYKEVRECLAESCLYLQKALPWDDQMLQAVRIVDPAHQASASAMEFLYLLRRFPALVEDGLSLDDLLSQLDLYKVIDISALVVARLDKSWLRIKKGIPLIAWSVWGHAWPADSDYPRQLSGL